MGSLSEGEKDKINQSSPKGQPKIGTDSHRKGPIQRPLSLW